MRFEQVIAQRWRFAVDCSDVGTWRDQELPKAASRIDEIAPRDCEGK